MRAAAHKRFLFDLILHNKTQSTLLDIFVTQSKHLCLSGIRVRQCGKLHFLERLLKNLMNSLRSEKNNTKKINSGA